MVNGLHAEIATALGADPNAELKVESASRQVCCCLHSRACMQFYFDALARSSCMLDCWCQHHASMLAHTPKLPLCRAAAMRPSGHRACSVCIHWTWSDFILQ
jgi:hypothetical protein